jgi:hypothetical protein
MHNCAVSAEQRNWRNANGRRRPPAKGVVEMDIIAVVSVLIAIFSIVAVGAIGLWAIERIVTDRRLALLLRLLVVLVCLGAIVHRLPALTY